MDINYTTPTAQSVSKIKPQLARYASLASALSLILSFLGNIFNLVDGIFRLTWDRMALFIISMILLLFAVGTGAIYLINLYADKYQRRRFWALTLSLFGLTVIGVWLGNWWFYTNYDPNGWSIENEPFKSFAFYGPESGKSWGAVEYRSDYTRHHYSSDLTLFYSIPKEGDGYVGLAIHYIQPIDVHNYRALRFLARYKNTTDRIRLEFMDEHATSHGILLDEKRLTQPLDHWQEVIIPLEELTDVNLKDLWEIKFICDQGMARGDQSFEVKEMHFIK